MKKMLIATIALGLISTVLMADGVAAYKKCAVCHGIKGEKPGLGKSKILKDMTKKELIDAMVGYQNGSYGGAMKGLMIGQVKTLSKDDIDAIATHIGK
jgi:cytochrome c553